MCGELHDQLFNYMDTGFYICKITESLGLNLKILILWLSISSHRVILAVKKGRISGEVEHAYPTLGAQKLPQHEAFI